MDVVAPAVELGACEPPPEMLRTIIERISEKTGKTLKPKVVLSAPAAFGEKAEAAGWRVEYRRARGPLTTQHRPDEPNGQGKYALVSVTRTVDSIGVRAQHPDGRRIAAWWVDDSLAESWVASPRTNARKLGIQALTKYLTETEDIEEETVNAEQEPMSLSKVYADAKTAYDAGVEDRYRSRAAGMPHNLFIDGYIAGHAAAADKAGDAYGEGYAAGLAAALNRERVWVSARRRLDALRPGDVILGKGDRWWIVTDAATVDRDTRVRAVSNGGDVEVQNVPSRMVDVVEAIATAEALATLKAQGIEPERVA